MEGITQENSYKNKLKVYEMQYNVAKSSSVNDIEFANKNARLYNETIEEAKAEGINLWKFLNKLELLEK